MTIRELRLLLEGWPDQDARALTMVRVDVPNSNVPSGSAIIAEIVGGRACGEIPLLITPGCRPEELDQPIGVAEE